MVVVVAWLLSHVQLFQPHGLLSATLLCQWDSPGKNTGVGCHFPLQVIFPTQESNPGLLHCRQILYQLSYKESPTIINREMQEQSPKQKNRRQGSRQSPWKRNAKRQNGCLRRPYK